MTNSEFSDKFEVFISSFSQKLNPGYTVTPFNLEFDEYEKSVFLTKAQEELVKACYNGANISYESFEQTEDKRRKLAELVTTAVLTDKLEGKTGLESYSVFYALPDNLMYITYESVELSSDNACDNGRILSVIPVTQDDYYSMSRNPFRKPEGRAYRLDTSDGIELICTKTIAKYLIRYIRRPQPIILVDLPEHLSIEGISTESQCELHPNLHQEILERAVALAYASRATGSSK